MFYVKLNVANLPSYIELTNQFKHNLKQGFNSVFPLLYLRMDERILILDFGSQYTQLIARRIRELNVYCEIHPYTHFPQPDAHVKGIILSGSPHSVLEENAPHFDFDKWTGKLPILGVCYGAQYLAHFRGGTVTRSLVREYGRSFLKPLSPSKLLREIPIHSQVWMSHGDSILTVPDSFTITAGTEDIPVAAFENADENLYGIQFHPEVTHSADGLKLLSNFAIDICGCSGNWTPASFISETIQTLRQTIGNDRVVLGLSGGVDSSVAALLLHEAIGNQLFCIFVDNGLLRKNEYAQVLDTYTELGLQIHGVSAGSRFIKDLEGISDPEAKRKIIGRLFIEVFEEESHKIDNVKWLGQGTIYPDVIESVSVKGPSATIKSHHNVGGLPDFMKLKVVEPLRLLFKDEVRKVGLALGLKSEILNRHPFPGPGLAIRILGDVTADKVRMVQEADAIFIDHLKNSGEYANVWQAGAIFLPVQSVGVMGDERTYEHVICLRAVTSHDGMTADFAHLPHQLLGKIANDIINRVKGINRVVFDISSKPPATIEWE
jgi:GMP synthase (glutamine-hydrolysing)